MRLKYDTNMEGNKDEAKKCLEFARRYLAKGDKEKAKKFLNKSQRLFPLKEAESKCCNMFRSRVFLVYFIPVYSVLWLFFIFQCGSVNS